MRIRGLSGKAAAFGLILAMGTALGASQADARSHRTAYAAGHSGIRGHLAARFAYSGGGGRLQCVPFARENTGIELSGNAATWWNGADGVYQRGARPEVGSVLNFRANGRMRMGHVAVVSNVVDSRNIEIDHANWSGPGAGRGGISRNIDVVDVSPNNDWTAVRVSLGHTGEFGSVYPTFGFIYDRPDNGSLVANNASAPAPVLNAAPRDLRPAADRMMAATAQENDEVAEAADDAEPIERHAGRRSRIVHAIGRASSRYAFSRFAEARYAESRYSHGSRRETQHEQRFASRAPLHREPLGRVTVTRVQARGTSSAHAPRHRT